MADPGFHDVAEAAALEAVDQPIEPAAAVLRLVIEMRVGTGARHSRSPGAEARSPGPSSIPERSLKSPSRPGSAGPSVTPIAIRSPARGPRILAEAAEIAVVVAAAVPGSSCVAAAQEVAETAGALRHQQHQERLDDRRHRAAEHPPALPTTLAATRAAARSGSRPPPSTCPRTPPMT